VRSLGGTWRRSSGNEALDFVGLGLSLLLGVDIDNGVLRS